MSACGPSHLLPPQDGTDAGEQFPEAERLDDVVVRTKLKADDAIDLVQAMAGRDDDWNIRMRADFPQHIQPVVLAEPQIQDDQTGNGPGEMTIEFCPIRGRLGRYTVILQIPDHHLPQRRVIINDNDMANIRKHELISQLFLSLDCVAAIRISTGNICHPADCPNRAAATLILSRTSAIGRRVPRTHSFLYQRVQHRHRCPVRHRRPANIQTASGTSVRNAHSRESSKRRRSR
jgi:hypothetical protein